MAFDVQNFDRDLPERTVAADGFLASGEFEKARRAEEDMVRGRRALKNKDPQAALTAADRAESLNPGFYQNATLRGRALLALGRTDEAAKAFESGLNEHPAFLAEKQQLEDLLKHARRQK